MIIQIQEIKRNKHFNYFRREIKKNFIKNKKDELDKLKSIYFIQVESKEPGGNSQNSPSSMKNNQNVHNKSILNIIKIVVNGTFSYSTGNLNAENINNHPIFPINQNNLYLDSFKNPVFPSKKQNFYLSLKLPLSLKRL